MEIKTSPIKGNVMRVTGSCGHSISQRMTTLDPIFHPAHLISTARELVAFNHSIVRTMTLLLARGGRVELLSLLVVSALVRTATLSKGNTLISTQNESRVTKTSFHAGSFTGFWSWETLTSGRAAISTGFIVGITWAGKAWKERTGKKNTRPSF